MKTTKEFPATHSMSTEWFVVDEDGNIALFAFEEDGPVPIDIPSESNSYLMTAEEDFGEKDSNNIEYLDVNPLRRLRPSFFMLFTKKLLCDSMDLEVKSK